MNSLCGHSRRKGLVFGCGGDSRNNPKILGKTRNQILHPRELKRSGYGLSVTGTLSDVGSEVFGSVIILAF